MTLSTKIVFCHAFPVSYTHLYRDADYIREELVAELTAALCGAMLGFATTPREESAAYIKDWLAEFHKEPTDVYKRQDLYGYHARQKDLRADRCDESLGLCRPQYVRAEITIAFLPLIPSTSPTLD